MFTVSDIKNVSFSNSIRGYKQDEVEAFLDKLESDYLQFEKIITDLKEENARLNTEIENYKNSQDSIQNVLLNAQKLAEKIVNEAKEKSEEIVLNAESNINVITAHEKELSAAFEAKAIERKENLQKELDLMIEKSNLKAQSIMSAAEDAVNRQQMLFDKLKLEISNFKTSVTAKYKEHLSILQTIPDTVEMDPQKLEEIISAKIDALPDVDSFIAVKMNKPTEDGLMEDISSNAFNLEEI